MVHWYRGTMKLVPNNNIRMVTKGIRNSLTFKHFAFQETSNVDFTCSGTSALGSSDTNFNISGRKELFIKLLGYVRSVLLLIVSGTLMVTEGKEVVFV